MYNIPLPSGKIVVLVALAVPAAYVLLFRVRVMSNIASSSSVQLGSNVKADRKPTIAAGPVRFPQSFPASVAAAADGDGDGGGDGVAAGFVLWHERLVSKSISLSALGWRKGKEGRAENELLLTRYVRGTMLAFARTPQAVAMRRMIPPAAAATFEAEYINAMDFKQKGQRIDGVYTVQYRGNGPAGVLGGERVELRLDPPEEYEGPKSDGMIVAAVEPVGEDGDEVVFANETWLWRRLDDKPTFLEWTAGRWLHSLLAAWLIQKGIAAVQREVKK